MKFKYIFFLPFLMMLAAACSKPPVSDTPVAVPTGTFAGSFYRLRYNTAKVKYDTLYVPITVTLSTATGYSVILSDTTLHSPSHGGYSIDANGMYFNDVTYTKITIPTKPHLVGTYVYAYDGTTLQLQQTYSDTLGFFYNLKKQ